MKALRFHRPGALDVLSLEDVPIPKPGDGELLIEIHAAAINPSDVKNVQGAMPQTTHPRTPGRDFAGVVVEGPRDWKGQAIFGAASALGFTRDGSHAEYVVAPLAAVARKPANLSMAEAASIGVPYLTAWTGLVPLAQLHAGETVLVVGGTGSVGTAVGQIGRWSGARVFATARDTSEVRDDWKRSVDVVIDLSKEELTEAVKKVTDERGVDVVFNAVGGPTFAPSVACLARRGRLVAIAAAEPREVSFNLFEFYRRDLRFHGLDSLKLSDGEIGLAFRTLVPGFESGALSVHVTEQIPLSKARDAYERLLKGPPGKLVLVMK